jgi:uncharacterized protein YrrD
MTRLVRASSITGRPVVTVGGESDYEIKDVVFDRGRQRLIGFTLREPGFFGQPVDPTLPWDAVHGIGPDAVIIGSDDVFADSAGLETVPSDGSGDVLGGRALTDAGTDLGKILEVIISLGSPPTMVGLEIEASEELHADAAHLFIPVPDGLPISDDQALLPATVKDYATDDLGELQEKIRTFNKQAKGDS